MKLILLAAAAFAMPAFAQTTGSTSDQTAPPVQQQAVPAGANNPGAQQTQTGQINPPDQSMSNGSSTMSNGSSTMSNAPASTPMGGTPAGGYQPSTPATNGPAQPGAQVTYQQAPSPDQAYPAPAPLAHYPICKPGQYDGCMQASDAHHTMARRRHK